MQEFSFESRDRFVNRKADLVRLEDWWTDETRDALCMYGRRRVGKSWLFRRFADGKQALVLVADERAFAPQFSLFAGQIEDRLGVRPAIGDVASLVRVLYRLGRDRKLLAVIDEFGRWVALGLVNLANALDPAAFVLGGGLAAGADLYLGPIRRWFRELIYQPELRPLPDVRFTQWGERAGAVGAALAAAGASTS